MRYTLWDSGLAHPINPYFELYTEYKPPGKEDNTEVNNIGGFINPKRIGNAVLDLENYKGKIHNLTFKQVYSLPGAPKLLVIPQK